MREADLLSCVEQGRLPSGAVFPIPVVLDVSLQDRERLKGSSRIELWFRGKQVGTLEDPEFYVPRLELILSSTFGTTDPAHPGVSMCLGLKPVFLGGEVKLQERIEHKYSRYEITPTQAIERFRSLGWKTIAGFQTRNVPHRAHEYLQKVALERCDGVFVHPLIGKKKAGDFSPESVLAGYRALLDAYFPSDRALLGTLTTVMRYAGPKEALFHALIRRNYGCTHFIVGRDHAGVGNYYDKYAAHRYIDQMGEMGIEILKMRGPYFCLKCDGIVTDKVCPHGDTNPLTSVEVSGTRFRAMIQGGEAIDPRWVRPEVVGALRGIPELFVTAEESEEE